MDADAADDRGGDGLTLAKALRRYALVEGQPVWDIDKAMKMKTAFVALVGQKVFKEWSEVTDEKKKSASAKSRSRRSSEPGPWPERPSGR
ncbi:hypothetical protein [Pseudomonas aeruginosa]|uniref:hypothetical protein n=1 Tax=Pseudomonas aeruginosa TaxID=287 RepID=UPI0035A67F79